MNTCAFICFVDRLIPTHKVKIPTMTDSGVAIRMTRSHSMITPKAVVESCVAFC